MGDGVVGSRGSSQSSYMVVEARLVSSCLSLPSRARPRFWRLAESRGVTEYVLENVELAATVSLEGWERTSQSQPQPRCSASLQAPGQGQPCPPCATAGPFPPFVPSSPSPLQPLLFSPFSFSGGHRLCLASKMQSEKMKKPGSSCAPSPGTFPAATGLCWWDNVHGLPWLLLSLHLLFTLRDFLLLGVKLSRPLSPSPSHPPPPHFSSSISEMPYHLWPLVPYFISSVHTVFVYLSREYRTTSVI